MNYKVDMRSLAFNDINKIGKLRGYMTEEEVIESFFEWHDEARKEREKGKEQNSFSTDVRVAFVEYIDYLQKDGEISEELASNITLKG